MKARPEGWLTATELARVALRSIGRDDLAARLEPNRRGDPKVGLLRGQLNDEDRVLVARAVDMAHRHRGAHRDPVYRWDHTAESLAADLEATS